MKRIAMLSVHTSPLAALGGKKTGGMNVYVREFAQELGRRGVAVDIYTRRDGPEQPDVDYSLGENVRVIHLYAGPAQYLDPNNVYDHLPQFTAGLIAFTTRQGISYDLIYAHYWLSGWVAHKLKEVWDTPFVQMFHTLGHMKNRIGTGRTHLPDTRIRVETQIVKWADCIIAATPAEQTQLMWLYRADRRKIIVAPPGVDASRFRPLARDKRDQVRQQLGIDTNCHWLLFVGRIEPLKAVDTILESLAIIRQQHLHLLERLRFTIIGGDPQDVADQELTRLQKLALELELSEVVSFMGAKGHDLLPRYYAAADAVIVPSDYESFGMVALEAMASGTPVIASKVGGLAFLVRDQETGLHIPARDPHALAKAIEEVLVNPQKRRALGLNAAHMASLFTWASIAARLLPVFQCVIAGEPLEALRVENNPAALAKTGEKGSKRGASSPIHATPHAFTPHKHWEYQPQWD